MATVCKIELEVLDNSNLQVAHAICKRYVNNNSIIENALIDLEELTAHIEAYVSAEKKALEVERKRAEEEGRLRYDQ